MIGRLTVYLEENERQALVTVAEQEMRDPREQIRYIVCQELQRRGLLADPPAGQHCEETKQGAPNG